MSDVTSIPAFSAATPSLADIYDLIAADARERDANRVHPHAALDLLRKAKFGALRLPKSQGGAGASLREVIGQLLLLAEADSNVAHIYRNHVTFVDRVLIGSDDPRRDKWRDVVRNGGIVGLAATEIDRPQIGGTLPHKSILTREGDGYRLNGIKFYSTGSLYADLILVRATGANGEGINLVVPTNREGVELIDDWDGMGQRVTGSGTTKFHNVRIEADEVMVDAEQPSYLTAYTSTIAQTIVTTLVAGNLRAIFRDAKAVLHGRGRNFYYAPNEIAAHDPLLQQTIGRIAAEAYAAEVLVLDVASKLDLAAAAREAGEPVAGLAHEAAVVASKAKVIIDELALRAGSELFDIAGASAAIRARNLDRHWRNIRTLASHNPAVYRAQLVGAYELHGTELPGLGFF